MVQDILIHLMRWLRFAHGWAGAAAALVLILIGITGAVLALRESLIQSRLPELRDAAPPASAEALAGDLETIERLAGKTGWTSAVLASPDRPWHHVRFPDGREAYMAPGADHFADRFDPVRRPESLLFELHTTLALGSAGETAVGIFGLTGFLLLITGLTVWLSGPKRLHLKALTSRRAMIDVHNFIGVTLFAPLLLFMATGVMMAYSGTGKAAFTAMLGDDAPRSPVEVYSGGAPSWTRAVATAEAAFPGARPAIAWPPRRGGPAGFRLQQTAEWHPNGRTVALINSDGSLISTYDAQTAAPGVRAWNGVYPLHFGRLNIWHRIFAVLAGAMLAISSLIGLTAFVRKQRRAWIRRRLRAAVAQPSQAAG